MLTHSIGLLYGIISAYWLLSAAAAHSQDALWGGIIFLAGFGMMFLTSSLYHYINEPRTKWMLKKADHISIYFMIAGSYTPFILIFYQNERGLILLSAMWILTFLGVIFKIFTTGQFKYLSTAIYVLMGLAILIVSDSFFPLLPIKVAVCIVMGGVYYLIGVLFYLRKSWYFHHPVWHLFVLAGALSHWWALYFSL